LTKAPLPQNRELSAVASEQYAQAFYNASVGGRIPQEIIDKFVIVDRPATPPSSASDAPLKPPSATPAVGTLVDTPATVVKSNICVACLAGILERIKNFALLFFSLPAKLFNSLFASRSS
jgi:hypothetical protein